jgi:hypothetical protein
MHTTGTNASPSALKSNVTVYGRETKEYGVARSVAYTFPTQSFTPFHNGIRFPNQNHTKAIDDNLMLGHTKTAYALFTGNIYITRMARAQGSEEEKGYVICVSV